jgi:hypothetical protein
MRPLVAILALTGWSLFGWQWWVHQRDDMVAELSRDRQTVGAVVLPCSPDKIWTSARTGEAMTTLECVELSTPPSFGQAVDAWTMPEEFARTFGGQTLKVEASVDAKGGVWFGFGEVTIPAGAYVRFRRP